MMEKPARLKKELGLFDVYAICTGAMFSSGFFLLPGLAAAQTGPSVFLAYFIAGLLMLPAMFSMAELSTAMPRAGGDYYFLDRALGPVIGTVGGVGTYLGLTLKSAFALVGLGAYLAIFVQMPIKPLAVGLAMLFVMINVLGAKETSMLQRVLVTILVLVMGLFILQGSLKVITSGIVGESRFSPFMTHGIEGLLGTVGFVFVSYAGLTKIASVSEEVRNPSRNIPLGMMLSIFSTSAIYVIGVWIMVAVLPPADFRNDLTPVATAGRAVITWVPTTVGVALIVAAAVAAFASTGNAGIMAASRYPLAMGRDQLIPPCFARIGRFRTPTVAILLTGGLMIVAIVLLDESGIAKLASAFQLLVFMLVNFTVIVMRQSRIEYYDPAYRSPFYPWMQLAGILASVVLISYLGHLAIALTGGVAVLALAWYFHYAHHKVSRQGAIYHWFERLGRRRSQDIEDELQDILREQELQAGDPFEEVIGRAMVLDLPKPLPLAEVAARAVRALQAAWPLDEQRHTKLFLDEMASIYKLVRNGVTLPHLRVREVDRTALVLVRAVREVDRTALVLVRCRDGVNLPLNGLDPDHGDDEATIHAFFFLVSPLENPGQHLRILAHLARRINDPGFLTEWQAASDALELKEVLLHTERTVVLWVAADCPTASLIGRQVREVRLPQECLITMIARDERVVVPRGQTVLREGDRLTILGTTEGIAELYEQYVADGHRPAATDNGNPG